MKYALSAVLLAILSTPSMAVSIGGGGGTGVGVDVLAVIEASSPTFTGAVTFTNAVVFSSVVVLTQGATVSVNAPITGTGSPSSPLGLDSSSVTLQGNEFNGPLQLVQLNGASKLPPVDGSLLTGLTAGGNSIAIVNKTGSTLVAGEVVYISGVQGGTPIGLRAQGDLHDSSHALGVVLDDINNNNTGTIISFGQVSGFDTSSFSEGDELYLSTSIAGVLTNIPPSDNDFVIHMGKALKINAVTGEMLVMVHSDHPQTGEVFGLTQGLRTTAELQTESCAGYPAIRCQFYNTDEDSIYTSTGSTAGQFRNTMDGTGP